MTSTVLLAVVILVVVCVALTNGLTVVIAVCGLCLATDLGGFQQQCDGNDWDADIHPGP